MSNSSTLIPISVRKAHSLASRAMGNLITMERLLIDKRSEFVDARVNELMLPRWWWLKPRLFSHCVAQAEREYKYEDERFRLPTKEYMRLLDVRDDMDEISRLVADIANTDSPYILLSRQDMELIRQ